MTWGDLGGVPFLGWSSSLMYVNVVPRPYADCAVVAFMLVGCADVTDCCLEDVVVASLVVLVVLRGGLDHLCKNVFLLGGCLCCLCSVRQAC